MKSFSVHTIQSLLYRRVIEMLREAVAVEDLYHRIIIVNEAFCKLTGFSEQEWSALGSMQILLPDELKQNFIDNIQQYRPEDSFDLQFMVQRKDQSFFHALIKASPVTDDDAQVVGRIITLSDITVQQRQLNAMIENDERLRFLMQSTSEGIVIHENGIITDVNDAVLRMTGYSYDELIGKSVFQFVSPKEHTSMRQVFKDKLMFKGERQIIDKQGRIRLVEVNSKLVQYKETEVRVITMRDITELHEKKIEEQRLISIIEASPLFVAMMDSNGLRYMNQPGRTMLGYEMYEDLSHLGVKELMSAASAEIILNEALPSAIENGMWQGQTTFKRKDGTEFISQQIIIAHKDQQGNVEFFSSVARDITEQLRGEEVLKESQQRLRYFMEESLEAIVIHDQGVIMDFNTAAYKMFGYESEELVGKPLLSLYETSFHKEITERINRLQVIKDEWIGVKKDGSLFDVEIYSRPHIYKDRDVRIVSVIDISARKRIERALRSSELLLNAAVEGTNVGIWEWNLVTNKMSFNEAWRKLRHMRSDQVPGYFDEWKQTVRPDDLPGLLEALKNHLHGFTPMFHYVYRSKSQDGFIVIESKGKLVRDENNMPVRIVGTAVDITDRQQMEDALRKSRAQLAALIENREETIWAIDPQYHLVNFNNSFAKIQKTLFGVDLKQGDLITEVLSPYAVTLWLERYKRCLQGESLMFVEDYSIDNEKVFIEYAANPVRIPDGSIVGVSVLGRNITQQKRFERSLQEAKLSAETANRTKSQFLANISHEIRTPMNGIIGFTDLLLQTKVNEKQKEYLDIVRYSADSLLHLINDLLDLSKIEAGKLLLGNREFDLRKLLRAVIKSFKPKVKQQHLEITISIDKNIPSMVLGDEMRLQQIFVNLIGNAVKFSDHGTVAVHLSKRDAHEQKVTIYAEVKDEGIGIPKDRQEAIFEAFHQLGDPFTSKYGGTGLGLSITKKLVSMMDGTIGVESEPGKGSLFHFSVDLDLPSQK